MTPPDVSDAAVEAALRSWFSGEDYEGADMSAFNDDMRAAIAAAVEVMLVPAGYIVEFKDKSATGKWYVHKRQGEGLTYDPCYTLRTQENAE